jgi:hypothetical protein
MKALLSLFNLLLLAFGVQGQFLIDPYKFESAAGSAFTYYSTEFDGSNDYLTRSSNLDGAADSQTMTVSFWVKPDGNQTQYGAVLWFLMNGNKFSIFPNSATTWSFICRTSAGANLFSSSIVDFATLPTNQWTHVVIAFDTATFGVLAYTNDVQSKSESAASSGSICLTGATSPAWDVGRNSGGSVRYKGLLSELIVMTNSCDLTSDSVRRNFITADKKPADPSALGTPLIYLANPYDSFQTNAGTGGDFTVTGTLGDGGADIP